MIDRLDHHVIASTWAFKCKHYPDGLIKKFKARFCARGDQQLEGIDFFETYAPVVQWTTIRLMFILEILLGLKSKQGDVTCAFLHADLEPGENVYVDMPLGFTQYSKDGTKKCLKLKKKSNAIVYHFIREGVAQDEWWTAYVNTDENLADLLTKPLSGPKQANFVRMVLYHVTFLHSFLV